MVLIYITVKKERGVIDEFEIAARTRAAEGHAAIARQSGERMVMKRMTEEHYDTRDIEDFKYWADFGDHYALVVMKAHATNHA